MKAWNASSWRAALAWSYVIVCSFDFMIGPILFNIMQYYSNTQPLVLWQAITLQGGGLYHLSMGAILGISSHGRTQEKLQTLVATPNTDTKS